MIASDAAVEEHWRRFAARLAVALVVVLLIVAGLVVYFSNGQAVSARAYEGVAADNDRLKAQVEELSIQATVNAKQAECRSRIAGYFNQVRDEREGLGWAALTQSVVIRENPDREARARETAANADAMVELNKTAADAADLSAQSVAICTANPDFRPPVRSKP